MSYLLEKEIWSSIFAVPSTVVDSHIKLCNETAIKALLILLRNGGNIENAELARMIGKSEESIADAIEYWMRAGVITGGIHPETPVKIQQNLIIDNSTPKQDKPTNLEYNYIPDNEQQRKIKVLSNSRARLSTKEIGEMAKKDSDIACLLQEAQSVIGKPLTPITTDTIVSLYSYYGMQPDLVLMLLQYCVTIGKDNMRYVEKVAANWLEKGIDSHEKAEAEIINATKNSTVEHKIKTAFGIYDRKLVSSEQSYVATWTEEFGYNIEMITLAFERAVEQKGKLSFPYIGGILSNWHSKGVRTPADALRDMHNKTVHTPKASNSNASYDINELEHMITHKGIFD